MNRTRHLAILLLLVASCTTEENTIVNPPVGDLRPPVITWLSPTAGAVVRDTVALNFSIRDDSAIDSIKVYVDGEVASILTGQVDSLYAVAWNSWGWSNGRRIVEVRAWDKSGNQGVGQPLGLTVDNHRVIWVPDEYEKIQDAIESSSNGDTIMVRAGTYAEQLQFFDKSVSLVSESGPEVTIIEAIDPYTIAWITGGQDSSMMIKGFTFRNPHLYPNNGAHCLVLGAGTSIKIMNNVFTVPNEENSDAIDAGQSQNQTQYNLFINLGKSVQMSACWGSFSNNMIINCAKCGFWNSQSSGQPLVPDYNLLWDYNGDIYKGGPMRWGEHNVIDQSPVFKEGTFRLRSGSPGVDQGDPDIKDIDGTRSDIGVYGGPYAYPPPL